VTSQPLLPWDALVLSPTEVGLDPAGQRRVFDDFERVIEIISGTKLDRASAHDLGGSQGIQATQEGPIYRLTPVLKSGAIRIAQSPVPGSDRISSDTIQAFLDAEFETVDRERSWGMQGQIKFLDRAAKRIWVYFPANTPLIDPASEISDVDGENVLAKGIRLETPWARSLTDWEHLDAFVGRADANPSWLRRRMRLTESQFSQPWLELRGVREGGDPKRYEAQWSEPRTVIGYLGWPAFLLDLAHEIHACPACGKRVMQGRQYCGSNECSRVRARTRKRESRAAPRRPTN
jgi:hypothetical protein